MLLFFSKEETFSGGARTLWSCCLLAIGRSYSRNSRNDLVREKADIVKDFISSHSIYRCLFTSENLMQK